MPLTKADRYTNGDLYKRFLVMLQGEVERDNVKVVDRVMIWKGYQIMVQSKDVTISLDGKTIIELEDTQDLTVEFQKLAHIVELKAFNKLITDNQNQIINQYTNNDPQW